MAKLLKITEMAKKAGIKPSTIRYYTDQGLIKPAHLTPGGHKLYHAKKTIARIRRIQKISKRRPTLKETQEIIAEGKRRHTLRQRLALASFSLILFILSSIAYLTLRQERLAFLNDWRNIYSIEEIKLAQEDWRNIETTELDREYLEKLGNETRITIKRGMSQALAAESPQINYLQCATPQEAQRLLRILEERCSERNTYLRKGNVVIEIISEYPSLRSGIARELKK